jgi:hypothetical protein
MNTTYHLPNGWEMPYREFHDVAFGYDGECGETDCFVCEERKRKTHETILAVIM